MYFFCATCWSVSSSDVVLALHTTYRKKQRHPSEPDILGDILIVLDFSASRWVKFAQCILESFADPAWGLLWVRESYISGFLWTMVVCIMQLLFGDYKSCTLTWPVDWFIPCMLALLNGILCQRLRDVSYLLLLASDLEEYVCIFVRSKNHTGQMYLVSVDEDCCRICLPCSLLCESSASRSPWIHTRRFYWSAINSAQYWRPCHLPHQQTTKQQSKLSRSTYWTVRHQSYNPSRTFLLLGAAYIVITIKDDCTAQG
jgi:hypothetical protein